MAVRVGANGDLISYAIFSTNKKFYSDNVLKIPLKECFQQPKKILSHVYGSR